MKIARNTVVTFRPDEETFEAMTRYREVLGVSFAQQIRRALREWLAERPEAWPVPSLGRRAKAARKQPTTRKQRS